MRLVLIISLLCVLVCDLLMDIFCMFTVLSPNLASRLSCQHIKNKKLNSSSGGGGGGGGGGGSSSNSSSSSSSNLLWRPRPSHC